MNRTNIFALFAIASVMLVSAVHAADWPQWRGPNRDGISQEKGLLRSWSSAGPKLHDSSGAVPHDKPVQE